MSNTASPLHPHEPAIPPALDAEGRCLVCCLIVQRDRLQNERDAADRACTLMVEEVDSLRAALTAITRNQSEKSGEEGICPFGCDAPWIALSALGKWIEPSVAPWFPNRPGILDR